MADPLDIKDLLKCHLYFDKKQARQANFEHFVYWAYSNYNVPVLRGVLVEYALVQHILRHAQLIAGQKVSQLSQDDPSELTKSLKKYYSTQIHGDVFDLQLHWGTTFEIKSTIDPMKISLEKTTAWGPSGGVNASLRVFPARYYIIAVINRDVSVRDQGLHFDEVDFYVCNGRDLDKLAHGQQSIRYSKIIRGREKVPYSRIWRVLQCEACADNLLVTEKLMPNWYLPKLEVDRVDGAEYIPTAMEYKDRTTLSWMKVVSGVSADEIKKIEWPWRPNVRPTGRDWEDAGFCYEDRRRYPKSRRKTRAKSSNKTS